MVVPFWVVDLRCMVLKDSFGSAASSTLVTGIDNTKKEEVALHEDHGDQTKGKKERHSIAGGSSNHARKWSSTLVSLSFVIFGIVFEIFAK